MFLAVCRHVSVNVPFAVLQDHYGTAAVCSCVGALTWISLNWLNSGRNLGHPLGSTLNISIANAATRPLLALAACVDGAILGDQAP